MKQSEMFADAKWIDCVGGDCSPVFMKHFRCAAGESVSITICGLGFFEMFINGKRVGNDLLVPSASCYSYRDTSKLLYPINDDMNFRTYCLKYDLTEYVTAGENSLRVMLGTGYYHQNMRDAEGNTDFGNPRLCYLIEKESGNVISDKSTLSHKGYFRRCNLYYGEYQDYTAVPCDDDFSESREIPTPETDYVYQIAPPDKVIESITEFTYLGEKDGARYYDCGKNTVGYAVLKCSIPGEYFSVAYAEEIGGGYWQGIHFSKEGCYIDEFVSDGKEREYHARFGWQGFRYLKLTGNCELVRVDVVHSDVSVTSGFECDNETLNWLYNTFVYTQLCNMHSGVPSDCPHRERLGYTGDGQLCCEAAMLTLDSKDFYRKWLYDISDCQCRKTGHVQHTAPLMGGGGGPCGWGGAIVEVPYKYYRIFGDKELLDEFFPKMLKWFDYLESKSINGLVCTEEEGGWCLGDWLPPQPIRIPEAYVNSCLYVGFMLRVKEIASILGRESEIGFLYERIEKVKVAVNSAYFSIQQIAYCGDTDGASCIALHNGFENKNVHDKLVEKYKNLKEFDTGIIATEALIGHLFDSGEHQLAFDLLSNENTVSFAYMKRCGATTLWENWNGDSSRNHPMFGAVAKYLFTGFLGIGQTGDSCGFKKIVISPKPVEGMNYAKGYITTADGVISVEYNKSDGKIDFIINVPDNSEAEFVFGEVKKTISGRCEFSVEA